MQQIDHDNYFNRELAKKNLQIDAMHSQIATMHSQIDEKDSQIADLLHQLEILKSTK